METQFQSSVDLTNETKNQLIKSLNVGVASTIDLYTQVKQAHWNIRGPQFFARHELFDQIAEKLLKFADNLAERAGTMGGYVKGTTRMSAENSKLKEYDSKAIDGTEHINILVHQYADFTKMVRGEITRSQDLGDAATEDLWTEILRETELDLWFLESHLNGRKDLYN